MRAMGKRSIASFLTVLLNVSWYVVSLGLALVTCLAIVSMFVDLRGLTMTIPVSFSVDGRTHRVTARSLGLEEAQIQVGAPGFGFEVADKTPSPGSEKAQIQHVRGSLRFPTQRGAFFFANVILIIVGLSVILWVLGQLRALFRTLRDGQPFVPANATRMRGIAFVVIGSELARSAIMFFENYYAMTHFSADGLSFDAWPDFNGLQIINGLIILVFAEVFSAGTRLDEDQSLTV
jgi:hypothetical protein